MQLSAVEKRLLLWSGVIAAVVLTWNVATATIRF